MLFETKQHLGDYILTGRPEHNPRAFPYCAHNMQEENEMNKIIIRNETPADYAAAEHLTREAFWNVYRSGCMEHYVLHVLRNDPAFVPELDLVMEQDAPISYSFITALPASCKPKSH